MKSNILIMAGLLLGSSVGLAGETKFSGYFRTGFSYSKGLTEGVCYGQGVGPGAGGNPGHFANSCDNLLEMNLQHYLLGKPEDKGIWTKVNITAQFFYDGYGEGERVGDGESPSWTPHPLSFGLPESYVQTGNALGEGVKIWVGKRWYRRVQFYQTDIFAVANTGMGVGVEDVDLGFGQLHAALIRTLNQKEKKTVDDPSTGEGKETVVWGPTYNNLDLRLTVPIAGLKYDFIYLHGFNSKKEAYGADDVEFEPVTGDLVGVFSEYYADKYSNRFYLGYGRGLFGGGGVNMQLRLNGKGYQKGDADDIASVDALKKSWGFFVIDESNFIRGDFSLGTSIAYGAGNLGTDDKAKVSSMAFGLQPRYQYTKNWQAVWDIAYTKSEKDTEDKAFETTKNTIAAVLNSGIAEYRFYYTYASWKGANGSKGPRDAIYSLDDREGSTVGVQVNVGW